MEYIYPAIFRVDEEDPGWINVKFPDLIPGVTCGKGMENAIFMAEDLLRLYVTEITKQVLPPSDIEKVRQDNPDALEVRLITVVITDA